MLQYVFQIVLLIEIFFLYMCDGVYALLVIDKCFNGGINCSKFTSQVMFFPKLWQKLHLNQKGVYTIYICAAIFVLR